ncbi:MAG: hypothetical protein GY953_22590, partial [bacterium]|nr:hypothetical protein [bacterium]
MAGGSHYSPTAVRHHRSTLAFMAFVLALLPGTASLCDEPSPARLFESRETLDFVLEIPMTSFLADRHLEERSYHPAHLTATATGQRLPLRLKMTGHQRAEDCALPPMKFRFTPEDIAGTLLEDVEQLYFTPVCNPRRRFEQYL